MGRPGSLDLAASPQGRRTSIKRHEQRVTSIRELFWMLLPVSGLLIALGLHYGLPNVYPLAYHPKTYGPVLIGLGAIYIALMAAACFWPALRRRLRHFSGIFFVLALTLAALDVATLKTGWLRLPFVPSPDKILSVYPDNAAQFVENFLASMKLLFTGVFLGTLAGVLSGILMGWSRIANYWISPVLKVIGPVPGVAWLPIAMVLMPSSRAAGLFLIGLALWFPLTLMISTAIRDTDVRLIESARVLGASELHILTHVAIPAAIPAMFTGMFMGLSASFGALIYAEMLGVKAGLGWYIEWSRAWGEYAKIFATIGIFIVLFFALIEILFRIRNHAMKWQKGVVRW
ncbi:MAG: ABC transporter permease subunit [Coriobacteriales bacterium]|jgi:NitT/TauT family transport system permease protein|nr:ABC transporter permease subunit [Coriobacteriales bacterium]